MSISSIERYREWSRRIENDPRFVAEGMKLAFADDLVRLLQARGLKRTELAEKLGTNRGYITRILNTEYNLSIETMAKIAVALDAQVTLSMKPRQSVPPAAVVVPARATHRRTRRNEFVASDKPARKRRSRQP
ncbi:MAG: helix-turn-helix transcriptional regulator [candidate division WOR-3 bacterium]|nr:helix-turn-helix transcriptional regulator [candidate division WOR-3 bacterium]